MPTPIPLREQAIIRDGLLPAREMARLLGVTTAWLRALSADGRIPEADRGHYPLRETVARFCRYYRRQVRSRAQRVDRAELALIEAKTRLINARCDEMERRRSRWRYGG